MPSLQNKSLAQIAMQWHQIYLLIYALLFALSFRVKNIVQQRRTGFDPYRFNKSTSPQQRFLERYGSVASAGWCALMLGFSFAPNRMSDWGIPLFLENSVLRAIALVFASVFLIGLITAQWQMGNNWRIGLDEENRTELVTTGYSRCVRNPVFTMILGGLGSIALALPCVATALLWVMTFSGLYIQVLAEEEFLMKQHGAEYERYKTQTGRFLPHSSGYFEITVSD